MLMHPVKKNKGYKAKCYHLNEAKKYEMRNRPWKISKLVKLIFPLFTCLMFSFRITSHSCFLCLIAGSSLLSFSHFHVFWP